MIGIGSSRRWRASLAAGLCAAAFLSAAGSAAFAQRIDNARGKDPRVDYTAFSRLGPWDDRNYSVTKEDLALLADNEQELRDPIPVFFRIELRRSNPGMPRTGEPQYPRSALQIFRMRYGGYLVGNKMYKGAAWRDGRYEVVQSGGFTREELQELEAKALAGDVRITSPTGAAESAVKIHPTDVNKVVAGSNGPGSGQIMWYSTNGGSSWTQAAALPQGEHLLRPHDRLVLERPVRLYLHPRRLHLAVQRLGVPLVRRRRHLERPGDDHPRRRPARGHLGGYQRQAVPPRGQIRDLAVSRQHLPVLA